MIDEDALKSVFDNIKEDYQTLEEIARSTTDAINSLKSDADKSTYDGLKNVFDVLIKYRQSEAELEKILSESQIGNIDILPSMVDRQSTVLDELYRSFVTVRFKDFETLQDYLSAVLGGFNTLKDSLNQTEQDVAIELEKMTQSVRDYINKQERLNEAISKSVYSRKHKLNANVNINDLNISKQEQTRQLQSANKQIEHLIKQLESDAKNMIMSGKGHTYQEVKATLASIPSMLANARKSGDTSQFAQGLETLIQQTLTMSEENKRYVNASSFDSIEQYQQKIEKYKKSLDGVYNVYANLSNENAFVDSVNAVEQSFNSAAEFIKAQTENYIDQQIQSLSQQYTNFTEHEAFANHMLQNSANAFSTHGTKYEQYLERNLDSTGFLNNSDFQELYNQYNLNTYEYNNIISDIQGEEQSVANFSGADKFDLFKDDVLSGRFTQPLISNNDSLIDLSHNIDKGKLRRGSKSDKQTAKDISDTIESAIKRTYKQIQSTSRFDPNSKLLDELKRQVQELEHEKEDIDSALADNSLKEAGSLLKDIFSPGKLLTTGLGFLGLGGLLSFNNWKNLTEQRANASGQMMYGNYMANVSMGADASLNAFDLVYNQGQDAYQSSYGMIDFNAPSALYGNLIKSVGGAYGASANSGALDLNYITQQMLVPTQLYGLGNGTVSQFMNAFYKTNRESAQESVKLINTVMANARKSNVPIETYVKLLGDMGVQFRNFGYVGKKAIYNIDFMINEGMRVEDAKSMQMDIVNSQAGWSLDKTNSVYALIAGQVPDLFTAMAMNLKTHDANGNPIGNRQAMIGSQMMAKLDMLGSMSSDPAMKKFLYMQELMNQKFSMKNANILSDLAISGNPEKVGQFLEGIDEEETEKSKTLQKNLKDYKSELLMTSELLGEKQKNKANMIASANKIAESFGSHHRGMQQFSEKIHSAIAYVDSKAIEFIKILAQLPEKLKALQQRMQDNPIGGFMLSHPILSSALALGVGYGGYRMAKRSVRNLFGNWNNAKSIAEQNKLIPSVAKDERALVNRVKSTFASTAKNAPKIGGGKLKAVITAGTLAASMLMGSSTEASASQDFDANSEEENISIWQKMLTDGSAKMTIKNADGTQYEMIGNNSISKWLVNNIGTAEIATAGLLGYFSLNAKSLYQKYKTPKIVAPKLSPIPPLEPLERPMNKASFIASFGGMLALSLFGNADEDMSASEMLGASVIDTSVMMGASAMLGKIPKFGKYAQFLPYLSGYIGDAIGIDPIGMLSDTAKDFFGIGGNKLNTTKFNVIMSSTAEIDARSFYKMMAEDSEQSEYFKAYLAQNGVMYERLTEVEKQIFAEMVQSLASAKLTLAQVLSLSAVGAGGFSSNYTNAGDGFMTKDGRKRLTKAAINNLEQQIKEQFLGSESIAQDWFKAEAIEKYKSNLKELETAEGDMRNKLNQEKNELSAISGYVSYLNGDDSSLMNQVYAELGIDIMSDEHTNVRPDEIVQKRKEIISRWAKYYYEWKDELIKHYRYRKTQEYLESGEDWIVEDNDDYNDSISIPNGSPITADPSGAGIFPQDAINQAQMVSQKTGIPVDYILAFFYLESNGLWELSEKLHNYGNTVYGGSKGKYNGFGWYATTEEGAEALANNTIAFADMDSRSILRQAALSDNPEAFVYQMKAKGYFEDDVNHYLELFRTGLGMARGAGVSGVSTNGIPTQGRMNIPAPKPQTLSDVFGASIAGYQAATGGATTKGKQGAIVNGMYVDTSQKFVSIRDKISALQSEQSLQSQWQNYNERSKSLASDATERAVQMTEEANIKAQREEQEKMKQMVDDEARRIDEQRSTESNIAHLTIMGALKKGKNMNELREAVEDILKDYGMDAKTYFKDTEQVTI